jgi:molybdenum cofactor cytidylyltransferase
MSELGDENPFSQQESGSKIGIMILAAGASTRMGKPKQLLLHRGQTLLRSAVETAIASVCRPIVVMIGAHAELLKEELEHLPILVVENREWEKGMSSSIRIGLDAFVDTYAELDGVVITLCDQPLVTPRVINSLVEAHGKTGQMIIASAYGEARGVPALFARELFGEILALEGNEGARQVIANHSDEVATIYFPEGAVDVDTQRDYESLSERAGKLIQFTSRLGR